MWNTHLDYTFFRCIQENTCICLGQHTLRACSRARTELVEHLKWRKIPQYPRHISGGLQSKPHTSIIKAFPFRFWGSRNVDRKNSVGENQRQYFYNILLKYLNPFIHSLFFPVTKINFNVFWMIDQPLNYSWIQSVSCICIHAPLLWHY